MADSHDATFCVLIGQLDVGQSSLLKIYWRTTIRKEASNFDVTSVISDLWINIFIFISVNTTIYKLYRCKFGKYILMYIYICEFNYVKMTKE